MKLFCKVILLILIFSSFLVNAGAQTHFKLAGTTKVDAMNINVLSARFNGMDLEVGDEIGIFDDNICCGVLVLTKSLGECTRDFLFEQTIALKKDLGGDGFTEGNPILFRFWDKSEQFECSSDSIVKTRYTNQLQPVAWSGFEQSLTIYVCLEGKSYIDHTPAITGDVFSTNEDTPLSASVAANDLSRDLPNIWTALTNPGHGTLAFNTDGSFLFTPQADYNGTESFTYRLCDGDGDCVTASVTITIAPVDDFPVAVADNVSTNEDAAVSGYLNANDISSGDGGDAWSKLTNPTHGTVIISSTGYFTYTPAANYNGSDSFIYKLCDGDGDCDTALVLITVKKVNDLPVAGADDFSTLEDTPTSGSLATNDFISGDGGTFWKKLTDPQHGTLIIGADGSFSYMPQLNYYGFDSFSYEICDADNDCATGIVNISVSAVNDKPFLLNSLSDQKVNTDRLLEILISPELGSVFNDPDNDDQLILSFKKDDGNPLPSFISKSINKLIIKPLSTDLGCFNIIVTATDKGGAFDTDTFKLCVVSDPVGIDDLQKSFEKVKVYPNPTSSHVTIDLGTIPLADLELRVLNLTGQSVLSLKINDRLTTIDFSGMSKGIYLVNMFTGQDYFIEKVIVQ